MKKVKSVLATCLTVYLFGLTPLAGAATLWISEFSGHTGHVWLSDANPTGVTCREGDSFNGMELDSDEVVLLKQLADPTTTLFSIKVENPFDGPPVRRNEYVSHANSGYLHPPFHDGIQQHPAETIVTAGPTANPIPEPASLILLGMGMIFLSISLKKRVRRQH